MKKILLIEDNGSLSAELIKQFQKKGYFVERAYSYSSALGIWMEDQGDYDCIILDLHINPNGIEIKELNKYAPIFGLAFLHKICEGKQPDEILNIYKKIIIYSGFIREFKDLARLNRWNIKHLKMIDKTGFSISELIKSVERICN